MPSRLASQLKVQFLGVVPYLKEEGRSETLNPQQIVSLSGILTLRGQSLKTIFQKIKSGKKNINERIKLILKESSLRGHASMSTTPVVCLTFEGSKFLDSALTGIIFSSSMMASGRRTDTDIKDIVYPDKIYHKKYCRDLYKAVSKNNIETFNYFLSKNVVKDEASKILQYGIRGTGIIQLPIESVSAVRREYEIEKDWMPDEVKILLQKTERYFKKNGLDLLYNTRRAAPNVFYPYPNIFKNPDKVNLVRDLTKKYRDLKSSKLISFKSSVTPELKKKIKDFYSKLHNIALSSKKVKESWRDILKLRQEILRDYYLALNFKFLSSLAWRVWGEKKRHRTCPMIVDSIYYSIDRTATMFKNFKHLIERGSTNNKMIEKINQFFYIPPSVKKNKIFLHRYLLSASSSFKAYHKLVKDGIKAREAIFLIPRAIKLDILQEYNFYNLLAGYYPLRLCQTVEEELRKSTFKEVSILKQIFKKKRLEWLNKLLFPKCNTLSFCPERTSCNWIKVLVKRYNSEFHQEMTRELDKIFKNKLKESGK